MMIPVYKPLLSQKTLNYAKDALDSTWISSQGKYLHMAEERLKEYLGIKHVLLTNNGTTAMHLVAKALRFRYPNKHNITCPNNVYVASWNSMLFDKELRLDPVDADEYTWNADYSNYIEYWSSAILVVHNLGNTVNVSELIKKYPKTPIIEDACESFGGEYNGVKVGTLSLCSALSFFGNKNITSGEGGAFITNDDELYEQAKLWWGQGMSSEKFIHSSIGYNYRMTNIEAALLYGQLEEVDSILNRKREIFELYKNGLSNIDVEWQQTPVNTKPSCWMFGIRVRKGDYKKAKEFFGRIGIETRPMFYPITHHKHLSDIKCNITTAEKLSKECIVLPSYPELTDREIHFITQGVGQYVKSL